MIEGLITGLDQAVEAVEQVGGEYTLLPKGLYGLKLVKVGDWETKNYKRLVVKPSGEVLENVDVFSCNLQFAVESPEEFKGVTVFDRLSTHPSVPWIIPGFLHAMGTESMKLSDLKQLEGSTCEAFIKEDSYEKKTLNKVTGAEEIETIDKNKITKYKRLELDLDI